MNKKSSDNVHTEDEINLAQIINRSGITSRLDFFKAALSYGFCRLLRDQLTQVASSLAYTSVLAAVPLLTVVLSLFTAFPIFNEFKIYLDDFLAHNLMPESISQNIMGYLNNFAQSASQLTAVGVIFLVVTSIMLMMTIEEALNKIWNVTKARSLVFRVLIYWAVLTLGPILLSVSIWATTTAFTSQQIIQTSFFIQRVVPILVPLCLSTIGITLLYWVVPNCKVRFKDALIGGFIAAVIFEIIKASFAYYIAKFPSYTLIYGAFAAVPLFLLWIYSSWIVFLLGASIASFIPQIRLRHFTTTYHSGLLLILAIQILRVLHRRRDQKPSGISSSELTTIIATDMHVTNKILKQLETQSYIVKVDDERNNAWALSCSENIELRPLIDYFLFDGQLEVLQHDQRVVDALSKSLNNSQNVRLKDVL